MNSKLEIQKAVLFFLFIILLVSVGMWFSNNYLDAPYVSLKQLQNYWVIESLISLVLFFLAIKIYSYIWVKAILTPPTQIQQWLWSIPIILVCLWGLVSVFITIKSNLDNSVVLSNIFRFVTLGFLIGFVEEFAFRGILLNKIKTLYNLPTAVLLSSLLFGIFHFTNLLGGVSIDVVVPQAIMAVVWGLIWGTTYSKTNNFWMVVIWHALYDICGFIDMNIPNVLNMVGATKGLSDIIGILLTVSIGFFSLIKRKK